MLPTCFGDPPLRVRRFVMRACLWWKALTYPWPRVEVMFVVFVSLDHRILAQLLPS